MRRLKKIKAVMSVCLMITAAHALPARAQDPAEQTLNLKDADIGVFIDDVAVLTGLTFIVDPKVTGKVAVSSNSNLSTEEVFQVFLATLRVHGYAAVPVSDTVYKIVPISDAASDRTPTNEDAAATGEAFVTDVIRLQSFSALEAAKMLKPMVNKFGHVAAARDSNALIFVDTASNMGRLRSVVAGLDKDKSVIKTVHLQNMSAVEMTRILSSLSHQGGGEGYVASEISIVPVTGSNSVVLRGESQAVWKFAKVASDLDGMNRATGDLKVIKLNHAKAETIVPVLAQVNKSLQVEGASSPTNIAFHAPTNSIILNADPETNRALETVIHQLDVRRPQVLIEAIIVELSDNAARKLGLQFMFSGNDNSEVPFVATNFSDSTPNILAISGAAGTYDPDATESNDLLDLAVSSLLNTNGLLAGVGGTRSDGSVFGVILEAVQNDQDSNVLSTPSIMTLDNEAANIIVGQEIPITTGEVLGSDNSNPFRTVDRQDVGIQMEVQPQINEGDSIQLHIRQEASSILGPVSDSISELITNKRELETTVLADNGEVIVLGGLIENTEKVSESKVPLLGDIPLAGRLFKTKARSKSKTNLMVFIRPTIIRTKEDAIAATSIKSSYITGAQKKAGSAEEVMMQYALEELMGQRAASSVESD